VRDILNYESSRLNSTGADACGPGCTQALAQRCVTVRPTCMDDVMFAHNGQVSASATRKRACAERDSPQGSTGGRSMMSAIALLL